jgi:hypothetical protein
MVSPPIKYLLIATSKRSIYGSILWRWNHDQREDIKGKEFFLPASIDDALATVIAKGVLFDWGFKDGECNYRLVQLTEL